MRLEDHTRPVREAWRVTGLPGFGVMEIVRADSARGPPAADGGRHQICRLVRVPVFKIRPQF
jgi:hypothetical protein